MNMDLFCLVIGLLYVQGISSLAKKDPATKHDILLWNKQPIQSIGVDHVADKVVNNEMPGSDSQTKKSTNISDTQSAKRTNKGIDLVAEKVVNNEMPGSDPLVQNSTNTSESIGREVKNTSGTQSPKTNNKEIEYMIVQNEVTGSKAPSETSVTISHAHKVTSISNTTSQKGITNNQPVDVKLSEFFGDMTKQKESLIDKMINFNMRGSDFVGDVEKIPIETKKEIAKEMPLVENSDLLKETNAIGKELIETVLGPEHSFSGLHDALGFIESLPPNFEQNLLDPGRELESAYKEQSQGGFTDYLPPNHMEEVLLSNKKTETFPVKSNGVGNEGFEITKNGGNDVRGSQSTAFNVKNNGFVNDIETAVSRNKALRDSQNPPTVTSKGVEIKETVGINVQGSHTTAQETKSFAQSSILEKTSKDISPVKETVGAPVSNEKPVNNFGFAISHPEGLIKPPQYATHIAQQQGAESTFQATGKEIPPYVSTVKTDLSERTVSGTVSKQINKPVKGDGHGGSEARKYTSKFPLVFDRESKPFRSQSAHASNKPGELNIQLPNTGKKEKYQTQLLNKISGKSLETASLVSDINTNPQYSSSSVDNIEKTSLVQQNGNSVLTREVVGKDLGQGNDGTKEPMSTIQDAGVIKKNTPLVLKTESPAIYEVTAVASSVDAVPDGKSSLPQEHLSFSYKKQLEKETGQNQNVLGNQPGTVQASTYHTDAPSFNDYHMNSHGGSDKGLSVSAKEGKTSSSTVSQNELPVISLSVSSQNPTQETNSVNHPSIRTSSLQINGKLTMDFRIPIPPEKPSKGVVFSTVPSTAMNVQDSTLIGGPSANGVPGISTETNSYTESHLPVVRESQNRLLDVHNYPSSVTKDLSTLTSTESVNHVWKSNNNRFAISATEARSSNSNMNKFDTSAISATEARSSNSNMNKFDTSRSSTGSFSGTIGVLQSKTNNNIVPVPTLLGRLSHSNSFSYAESSSRSSTGNADYSKNDPAASTANLVNEKPVGNEYSSKYTNYEGTINKGNENGISFTGASIQAMADTASSGNLASEVGSVSISSVPTPENALNIMKQATVGSDAKTPTYDGVNKQPESYSLTGSQTIHSSYEMSWPIPGSPDTGSQVIPYDSAGKDNVPTNLVSGHTIGAAQTTFNSISEVLPTNSATIGKMSLIPAENAQVGDLTVRKSSAKDNHASIVFSGKTESMTHESALGGFDPSDETYVKSGVNASPAADQLSLSDRSAIFPITFTSQKPIVEGSTMFGSVSGTLETNHHHLSDTGFPTAKTALPYNHVGTPSTEQGNDLSARGLLEPDKRAPSHNQGTMSTGKEILEPNTADNKPSVQSAGASGYEPTVVYSFHTQRKTTSMYPAIPTAGYAPPTEMTKSAKDAQNIILNTFSYKHASIGHSIGKTSTTQKENKTGNINQILDRKINNVSNNTSHQNLVKVPKNLKNEMQQGVSRETHDYQNLNAVVKTTKTSLVSSNNPDVGNESKQKSQDQPPKVTSPVNKSIEEKNTSSPSFTKLGEGNAETQTSGSAQLLKGDKVTSSKGNQTTGSKLRKNHSATKRLVHNIIKLPSSTQGKALLVTILKGLKRRGLKIKNVASLQKIVSAIRALTAKSASKRKVLIRYVNDDDGGTSDDVDNQSQSKKVR